LGKNTVKDREGQGENQFKGKREKGKGKKDEIASVGARGARPREGEK